jgi:hypothetical protein
MVGIGVMTVGLAMIFYSVLAMREQRNPDRRDLGATPGVRAMIIAGILLLVVFLALYTYIDDQGLATMLFPNHPFYGLRLVDLVANIILGASLLLTLGSFALRFHYLIRPVRKKVMSQVYLVGAIGLAQTGVIALIAWAVTYPLLAWIHSWTFIGLNSYLSVCSLASNIPGSCTFSQQAGYIVDAVITGNFLVLLLAAVWAWKSHRNLVVIGSIMTVAIVGAMTLMTHTDPTQIIIALILTVAMLIMATIWSLVARREFAVVGEKNLGCLGMWLVAGTCLFVYIGSFALFSLPVWSNDTEANITFTPGLAVPPPTLVGQAPTLPAPDAIMTFAIMGILALIQFYFLVRNRYKV